MKAEWNKNDASQIREKFSGDGQNGANGTNGTNTLQNGLLQYAANEISKGKGKLSFCNSCFMFTFIPQL